MRKWLCLIVTFCLLLGTTYHLVAAQTEETENIEEVRSEYDQVREEIAKYEKEISTLESRERTLANQISQFESQINLTQLQIQKTQVEIVQLREEIKKLQFEVDSLEIQLEKLSLNLARRAVDRYERGEITPLKLIATNDGFSSLVTKYAYAAYLQDADKLMLLSLKDNQDNVEAVRLERKQKQEEVEKKRQELERLQASLNNQKRAKENLLTVTKNDEAKYRQLLEAARSKEQQLAKLIFRDGKVSYSMGIYGLSRRGSISRGSRVGTMGNSGAPRCSTAAHLHYEVLEKARVTDDSVQGDLINPLAYLEGRDISYFRSNNTIDVRRFGAGSWPWPLANPVITQEFGQTQWSQRYTAGFHTGIDMVDYNNYAVTAPEGGTLYYAKIPCGNPINIGIIEHSGGVVSMFLHLQ